MKFEYDAAKSRDNFTKHGIDFETAKRLWKGSYVEFSALSEYENRFAILGKIEGKLYTCIFTLRGANIRIISCRRARDKESKLYEKNFKEA